MTGDDILRTTAHLTAVQIELMMINVTLDDLPCAVMTVSRDGLIEAVNATFLEWSGYKAATLVGSTLSDVLQGMNANCRLRCASGDMIDVEAIENMNPRGDHRVIMLLRHSRTSAVDATRKALDDANALLDTIFETAPIGLGVWDNDLRFVRVNKRLAEINGVPPDAHIGKRPHEILPEIDNIEEIYARWRLIFETGESWNNFEVRGATPAAPGTIRTWNENFYPIKVQGGVIGIGAVVEETTERKRHLEQIKSLVKELNHRCKNLLSIVLAIARQTSRAADPEEFIARFTSRIQGLVASHDLLVRDDWKGVAMTDLIVSQCSHFEDIIGTRLTIAGPDIRLRPSAAQGLGMAIHELATNAVKYGALSNATGKAALVWVVSNMDGGEAPEPSLLMRWIETGGPPVTPPTREGFGRLVIGKLLEASVNGSTSIEFAPEGVTWTLSAPLSALVEI